MYSVFAPDSYRLIFTDEFRLQTILSTMYTTPFQSLLNISRGAAPASLDGSL